MNPAESGNLANRITFWKSQKPVGGKRTDSQWMGVAIATVNARWLQADPAGVEHLVGSIREKRRSH